MRGPKIADEVLELLLQKYGKSLNTLSTFQARPCAGFFLD